MTIKNALIVIPVTIMPSRSNYSVTDVAVLCISDMEKTNSEHEKQSISSAETRIRKYQVRKTFVS